MRSRIQYIFDSHVGHNNTILFWSILVYFFLSSVGNCAVCSDVCFSEEQFSRFCMHRQLLRPTQHSLVFCFLPSYPFKPPPKSSIVSISLLVLFWTYFFLRCSRQNICSGQFSLVRIPNSEQCILTPPYLSSSRSLYSTVSTGIISTRISAVPITTLSRQISIIALQLSWPSS